MAAWGMLLKHLPVRVACTTLKRYHRLHHSQLASTSYRYRSSKAPEEEIDLDKPFKFSTSQAATWKPRDSYGSQDSENKMPWYQPYVLVASISTFLLYFCLLREENEADENLRKTLYDYIEGMEEKQLEMSLEHNIQMGKDTNAIITRLKEIRESQNKSDPS